MKSKKAKRVGRKRQINVKRQPNGQPSRVGQSDKIRSVAKEARERIHGAPTHDSLKPEWGFSLGRALLRGDLSQREFQAGLIAADVISFYYRMKCYPKPTPQAFDMFRVIGLSHNEPREETIKAAEKDFMRLQKAMRSTAHPYSASSNTIQQLCVEDHDMGNWPKHMTRYLKETLKAVMKEFPERIVVINEKTEEKS